MNENFYSEAVQTLRRTKTFLGVDSIYFRTEKNGEQVEINISSPPSPKITKEVLDEIARTPVMVSTCTK